jgi:hypothetical protein
MYYDANPSKGLTPAGEIYRDHRASFAYNSAYTKEPVWWTPGIKKPSLTATYDAAIQKLALKITNENTDTTDSLVVERFNDSSWETLTTFNNRQKLENKLVSITVSDFAPGQTKRFRVTAYTLFGGKSTSDEFVIGGIKNSEVVANSKTDIPGWTCVRSADNGFTKEESGDTYFEVWHPSATQGISFDYYQDITEMENGIYRLGANVFQNGAADGAVALYGQTADQLWAAPVMTDGAITDPAVSVDRIAVTGGKLRVGVRNIAPMKARWAGADNFVLKRVGDLPSSENELLGLMDEYDNILMSVWPQNEDNTRDASGMIINPHATAQRTDGWVVQNVQFSKGEAYDGDASNPYFNYWSANSYTSSMTQTISVLPAGDYIVSALLRGSSNVSMTLTVTTGTDTQHTQFTGTGTTPTGDLPMGWQKVTTPVISVKKGEALTISLTASGTSWWSADNFQLTLVQADPTGIDGPTRPVSDPSRNGGEVYDLQGRKINSQLSTDSKLSTLNSQLKRGIYLIDGKKVIIK